MNLPAHDTLPVQHLVASFKKTSATYKFYWFLSIIQSVELDETTILKTNLFARIVANAWYTINYFNVSFGKQDKLQRAIEELKLIEGLQIDSSKERIARVLVNTTNKSALRHLRYFDNQVPHWFLSPWFPKYSEDQIYRASKSFENSSLYGLYSDKIVINPAWIEYLKKNSAILQHFCYWNLALYLQTKNPNVPDIPNKLIKPATRGSLSKQRKEFWDVVLREVGEVKCIYTGESLGIGGYDVEHFIPYSFVSHDLIWNLIPAHASFNRSKSNKLPSWEKHFDKFFQLQQQAVIVMSEVDPNSKYFLEYLSIFPTLDGAASIARAFNQDSFAERMKPLFTIAANNGFQSMS